MPTDLTPGHRGARRRLLSDGAAVTVRRLGPEDRDTVARLHAGLPLADRYLRFFGVSTEHIDELADRVVSPEWTAVGAFEGDRLIGVAHYYRAPGQAHPEVAVAVAHEHQHRGCGTVLLEELVGIARAAGITRLDADVLAINHDMTEVLDHLGLTVRSRRAYDVREVTLVVPPAGTTAAAERFADAVLDRATTAEVAGLRPVLRPRSVAVIGAGHRPTSVGRLILRRIVECGFTGCVEVVARNSAAVAGIPARCSVDDLPDGIDLAVICVPAPAVVDVARRCGERGVRALLVISSGIDEPDELLRVAARYGMRVVGPNCLGLSNTEPDVRLQATFGPIADPGCVGLATQSGGVAIALIDTLNRLGLGLSTSVSLGDGIDVGAADLAAWWLADERTRAAVLYLESMPDPRTLARHLRRLAARVPVIAIRPAGSAAAERAAAAHTAARAAPRAHREALLRQSGVIVLDDLDDVPGLLALHIWQPAVAGRRVAILSNAAGLGVLAADACADAGLDVPTLSEATQEVLTACLPAGAVVTNPVDATATVAPQAFADAVDALLAAPEVDAVLALGVATAEGDPLAGCEPRTVGEGKPLVLVRPSTGVVVTRHRLGGRDVPVFTEAADAARALATAARRTRWLRTDHHRVLDAPPEVQEEPVRDAVRTALATRPEGGWLPAAAALAIGRAAGLPLCPTSIVQSAQQVEEVRRELGVPVVVKPDVDGLTGCGGVHLNLDGRPAIRAAVRDLRDRFGTDLTGIVVQPMLAPGLELLVGAVRDPEFGPVLTVGLGGASADLVDDRAYCTVPPETAELDHLLDDLRCAPRLLARPDSAEVVAAVRDTAARVAWLADRFAEIAEIEVAPLVVGPGGAAAVDLRIRVTPVSGIATNADPVRAFRP
ncbi:Acyl-CoA synthetase (NDP forming) [Pseudonocardia thermophila]|uniref:Acyl-CoA synthetase (NDP forming) n=2 Tax=Pseudonocardia thermophila TaxID=1848 RepID=A0A1M6V0D7_PSETH|nr:GNAT family N-acetyltransferase [Pseudonocardia thermophila]SHK74977.1 Acyl-CoA synthetase (NDP forming) [Pseudonocardia thermophila]